MSFGPVDRRAVASVAAQFFVNGAIFASFIPRFPEIRDRIGVSTDGFGALMTTALLIGLLGSAASANLISRFGTRRTLIVGAASMIATLPVIGLATAPIVFVVWLGLLSALDVVVDVSMNLQGSWLSARRHAPIMNRLHGLWSLGTVVGGLTSAQLTAAGVSLRDHLLAVSAILFFALVFVGQGLLRDDEHAEDRSDHVATTKRATRGPLLLLAFAGAFAIVVELVSSDWAAFRLRDDFETTAGFAGLGFVAFTSGMTLGRFAGDSLQHRLGSARLGQLAVAAAGVGLTAAAFLPNEYLVLAGYFVAGVGVSTFFPRLYDEAAQLAGKRGAGLGALTAGSRVAGVLAPVAVGSMAATSLSIGTATGIIVIPAVVAFAALTLRSPATAI